MRPTAKTVQLVLERDDWCCVRCGKPVQGSRGYGWSIHHRVPAGMGGSKRPEAHGTAVLVVLCGHGTYGCHGEIERHRFVAEEQGWLVRKPTDPATVPLTVRHWDKGERVVFLTTDGSYSDTSPEGGRPPVVKALAKPRLDPPKLPNQEFAGRQMQAKYRCLHCPGGAWHIGGASLFSRHLFDHHGIDDMFPKTVIVDDRDYVIGIDGARETRDGKPVKATRDATHVDGWLRSFWSVNQRMGGRW